MGYKRSKSFHAYLAIIVLSPLPLGSNRLWAWSLLAAFTFFVLFRHIHKAIKYDRRAFAKINSSAKLQINLLLLTAFWVFLQPFFIPNLAPNDLLLNAIKSLFFIGFFILGAYSITNLKQAKTLMLVIVVSAIFQATYGAFMTLSGLEFNFFAQKTDYLGRATGTFINRNHFAGYLELSLAISIGLMISTETDLSGNIRQKTRKIIELMLSSKALVRLGIIIMVIALVLSRSRMGNTAFFASLFIAGVLALILMRKKSKSLSILLISLIIFDIAILSTFFGLEKVTERIQGSSLQYETRDEVAQDALNMFLDRPLTGHGLGSFKHTYPAYRSESVYNVQIYDYVHNDYLQFLLELGIIPFLLLLLVCLISLKNALLGMRKKGSSLRKGMAFASLMGISAIAIHSTVDFNLQIPANALLFMVILNLGNLSYHRLSSTKTQHS